MNLILPEGFIMRDTSADTLRLSNIDHFSHAQVEEMLGNYHELLSDLGYEPVPYPDPHATIGGSIYRSGKYDCLNHALWMCEEARGYVRQGRWAKAHRWIGMIQGLLFMSGLFSVSDLKKHNRTVI